MKVDVAQIIALANALSPYVAPASVGVAHIIGALQGAGTMTDLEVDDDLRALIGEALTYKAEADRAAAGQDPR